MSPLSPQSTFRESQHTALLNAQWGMKPCPGFVCLDGRRLQIRGEPVGLSLPVVWNGAQAVGRLL